MLKLLQDARFWEHLESKPDPVIFDKAMLWYIGRAGRINNVLSPQFGHSLHRTQMQHLV